MNPTGKTTNPQSVAVMKAIIRHHQCAAAWIAMCAVGLPLNAQQEKLPPLPEFPPIPELPPTKPVDSLRMGDSKSAPEVLLDLPIAPGPYQPTWASIEKNYPGTPHWLREAKFGIWVHFGPQSAGESGDWYARKMYVPGTPANRNHLARFGHPSEHGYMEVLHDWNPTKLDPAKLTALYKNAGARFLIIQGVHHDQYDMWDSTYQPWNSTRIGARRDLVGEWAKAARADGLHFGITFHHEYSWWWWQTAFKSDTTGDKAGVPYDGHLTLADGKGKWWDGLDPRLLYGVDLRQYKGVSGAANDGWSPPPAGIFQEHADYAKWYATWWALRMMDAVSKYNPDFIYTDGTSNQPFSGGGTGTGLKADAMQRVMADYYNRTLARRGKVDVFSIVKFRPMTNGTVNTEEFGIPNEIKTDQSWIAEAPVGDWFYGPNFTYDSGMMIHYVVEAAARDGNAALNVPIKPDGSVDDSAVRMLDGVGKWMRTNGQAIYGSKAWKIPGEGQVAGGHLRKIPGGALRQPHADFEYATNDFRFTVGKDGALYAICMTVPKPGEKLTVMSLGKAGLGKSVGKVSLLGHDGAIKHSQDQQALTFTCPPDMPFATAVVFRID
jgi:alpha-L-fucosidase